MKPLKGCLFIILFSLVITQGQTIIPVEQNRFSTIFSYQNKSELRFNSADDSLLILSLDGLDLTALSPRVFVPEYRLKVALPELDTPRVELKTSTLEEIQFSSPPSNRLLSEVSSQLKVNLKIISLEYLRNIPVAVIAFRPVTLTKDRIKLITSCEIAVYFKTPFQESIRKGTTYRVKELQLLVDNPEQAYPTSRVTPPLSRVTAPLPAGEWIRIPILKDGIYRLDAETVLELLQRNSLPIQELDLFCNQMGGRPFDPISTELPSAALINIPFGVEDGGDDTLNTGDFIYFYARGPSGLVETDNQISYIQNPYYTTNYYWLLVSQESAPDFIKTIDAPVTTTNNIDRYEYIFHREIDNINFLQSGLNWYESKLTGPTDSKAITFSIPDAITTEDGLIKFRLKGAYWKSGYSANHKITLSVNGYTEPSYTFSARDYHYIQTSVKWNSDNIRQGLNNIILSYQVNISDAEIYFDWLEVHALRKLIPFNNYLDFWLEELEGEYTIRIKYNSSSTPFLFKINNFLDYQLLQPDVNQNEIAFTDVFNSGKRAHYILTTPENMKKPENLRRYPYIDWNSLREVQRADYLIITPEQFRGAAERLADYYNQEAPPDDRLLTKVVSIEDIYTQFSGGVPDPNAIKMFLHWTNTYWAEPVPEFVLLLGDASCDYRGLNSREGNIIPTFQIETVNSNIYYDDINNRPSDWRFVIFNENSVLLQMAIGRVPARTREEAENYVDRLIQYATNSEIGLWRTTTTFVADDPNRPGIGENSHTDQSEKLVKLLPPSFLVNKIYMINYPEVTDASTYGVSKPSVTEAIIEQLSRGTLLINYIGHGGPTIWAQEYVLVKDRDLSSIKTNGRYPIWIAGTCDWARYDMIYDQSMGEAVMLATDAGVATFAASRKSFGYENFYLISNLFRKYFTTTGIQRIRLGKAIQAAFTGTTNDQKFVLLGDPALYPVMPYDNLKIYNDTGDTLPTLSRLRFHGKADSSSTQSGLFLNGRAYCIVQDADREVTRNYTIKVNEEYLERNLSYIQPGQKIFSGILKARDGQFQGSCIIPKDITFSELPGKIKITLWDSSGLYGATGTYEPLYFKGTNQVEDSEGPEIQITIPGRSFQDGDYISIRTRMRFTFSDPLGINLTNQIGHTIKVTFDENEEWEYNLTEDFLYDPDSDTSGYIETYLPYLPEGEHTISVEAWDNANNLSRVEKKFYITHTYEAEITDVYNFPNPFRGETDFTFNLTNRAEVTIVIYTVYGREIRRLSPGILDADYHIIHFDGRDWRGEPLARGTYLYKIRVKDIETGKVKTRINKMVKG